MHDTNRGAIILAYTFGVMALAMKVSYLVFPGPGMVDYCPAENISCSGYTTAFFARIALSLAILFVFVSLPMYASKYVGGYDEE